MATRRQTLPPEFSAWVAIRSRDPASERWCSFVDFYLDVGPRPSWRHLLIGDDPTGEQIGPRYRRRRATARTR
jgi:hypothetical protein